jgi:hypothetical protein
VGERDPAVAGRDLAGLDDPDRHFGREERCGFDDIMRCVGDVERRERIGGRPRLAEDVFVCTEEDHRGAPRAELLEV